ncbi:uncharacterized protein LOC111894291 [Lactuca sativa]|uniref:uncharacterized protein LOC111894291 n=1 Tax=Lactuca sativa TaxID=4236 RepID=UPI000CBDFA8E|nr:uncharacterized protein LOC111894291 [Lactuca sativa]
MGNCSFKGFDASLAPIHVMTSSGQVLEFFSPKLVSEVVKGFPRHGIFKKDQLLSPLDHCEQLIGGQFYYLFPLAPEERNLPPAPDERDRRNEENALIESEPVRMSTSAVALQLVTKKLSDGSGFEVLPPPRKGVWKVKLVINTKQLEEILSEEVNTEALIEQMRAAVGSTKVVPRWSKGYWGVKLKPILCNVLNKTVVDDGFLSPKSVTPLLQ